MRWNSVSALSGAAMCFDALEQGSIDMFVEYTGTALLNLLAPAYGHR